MNGTYRDLTRVETRAELEPWLTEVRDHDCYTAEVRLAAVIDTNKEQARELAEQDKALAYLQTMYARALHQIEELRREIDGLLDSTRPRTQVERDVAALQKIFGGRGR